MYSIDDALRSTRVAVDSVIAAAEASGDSWALPRAPGKWSSAQIVEHIARSLEESAHDLAGAPSKFPNIPPLFRPVVRTFLFKRILKKRAFPKSRTSKSMDPSSGPDTPAAGRSRLEVAFQTFERECRSAADRASVFESTLFGRVLVIDYVRFHDLHTLHHLRQMTDPRTAITSASGRPRATS
jgi:hypothetical protein